MTDRPKFLYVTCQVGAEPAVKDEVARRWDQIRFAYSRPGFLTFKLPPDHDFQADFDLDSVFARAYGFSLGKVMAESEEDLARQVWDLYGQRPVRRVHVWPRDRTGPGTGEFEPGLNSAAFDAQRAILKAYPYAEPFPDDVDQMTTAAKVGDFVLDCVLVEPGEWWVGYHRAKSGPSCLPGGMATLSLPEDAASRAWLKMEEGLRWSGLPIGEGARCVDVGSAPGGAAQALLSRGAEVIGIDPAAMDPAVLEHPNFHHIRRRVSDVRRRDFRKARWLTVDMNVAPSYTLDAIEHIVTHPGISIRGILATIKLLQWNLAAELPDCIERVRSWGYNQIAVRQLQYNRQEVCLAALQKPFVRKGMRSRVKARRTSGD